ncbi:MAG: site-specific integrase [Oscillospiraceae bacterium]|nr:site-specific integrase [Oscillospiraceae bacterium]
MANIEKRGENTYRLTAYAGYDSSGKQLKKRKTVKLKVGLTDKQRDKELNRLATLFDDEVEKGLYLDGDKITFREVAQMWLEHVQKRHAPKTLATYKSRLTDRIIPALGHIKLSKIQPHHLEGFYDSLEKEGVRLDAKYSPTVKLGDVLNQFTAIALAEKTSINERTIRKIKNKHSTNYKTAEKLCVSLNLKFKDMFKPCGKTKLSEKSIRHHHDVVRTVLSFAVKRNLITTNPAQRVDFEKMPEYEASYYDETDITTLCEALRSEPIMYRTLIYLAIDSGMRTGEITGLLWSDIDFETGYVTVTKQRQYVNGYGIIIKEPKTKSGKRILTLSATVTSMLKEYYEEQKRNLEKIDAQWSESLEVFTHADGVPIYPGRPHQWFTGFLKRHNLKKITFHQLRHTNASLMIAAGVDMVTLANRLGHADSNITQSTYAHIIRSKEKQAANVMDMFYTKTTATAKKIERIG